MSTVIARVAILLALLLSLGGCDVVLMLERPDDRDRDGVADADDNCPTTANRDQADGDGDGAGDACACRGASTGHDEDADQVDDACDNCPHVANADQLNTDGDQVGDACDVADDGLECILRFDPFVTMPTPAAPPVGSWQIDGERLVQTDSVVTRSLFVLDVSATSPRVETSVETRGGTRTRSAGVWIGIDRDITTTTPGLPLGISTLVTQPETDPDAIVATSKTVDPTTSTSQELATVAFGPPVVFDPPARADLSVSARDQVVTARATVLGSSAQFKVGIPSAEGGIGLRTVRLAAAFDYVFITEHVSMLPCP